MNNRKSVAMLVSMLGLLTFFGVVTALSAQRITPITNAATPNLTPIQGECLTIQIGDNPNGTHSTPTISDDWVAWTTWDNTLQKRVGYTWDGRSTVKHSFSMDVEEAHATDDYAIMVIVERNPNTGGILSSEVQIWDGTQYDKLPITPKTSFNNFLNGYERYPTMINVDNRLYFIDGNQLQYYNNNTISTLITDNSLTDARLFMGGSVIYWMQYDENTDTTTFYSWRWDTQVITSFRTTTGSAFPINGQSGFNNGYNSWFYKPIYNGNSLYWHENDELWVYDGINATQITTDGKKKGAIYISNTFLAWTTEGFNSFNNYVFDLFVYDANGISQLDAEPYATDDRSIIAVSDELIIFRYFVYGGDRSSELMMYDGNDVYQLTDYDSEIRDIAVSGNKFFYSVFNGSNNWLYYWDGERLLEVDLDTIDDRGTGIAFDGYRLTWKSFSSVVQDRGNIYAAICPPDVDTNNDTVFNAPVDAMFVLNRIGQAPVGANAVADIDGDGDIDFADVRYIAQHLGGTIVVPTPEF